MALALRRVRLPHSVYRRYFASSAPVLKKRRATSSLEADDLFGSAQPDEGDLFSSLSRSSESAQKSGSKQETAFRKPSARKSSKKSQNVKSQYDLFDEHYAFIMDRLGPKPVAVHPQVRNGAIRRLLHHSRGPEHLERVMEALVKWRNDERTVDEETAIEIIDRVLAWQPPLILKLLADKPRYGVTIPNIAEARRILRRLVLYRPPEVATTATDIEAKKRANAEALKNAVTFAALLPAHGLKDAPMKDEVCCALLAQACARNLVFAEALERKKVDATGEVADVSIAPTKRAPLGTASTRGLLAISSSLASLFSPPAPPPSSSSSSSQLHSQPDTPILLGSGLQPERELSEKELAALRRMSGVTQTPTEERSWVSAALRDVVRALQGVRETLRTADPGTAGAAKKSLEVLERKFEEMNVGVDGGNGSEALV